MLSKKIGIDLGTSRVLVYVKGEGVIVNEPALMATDEKGVRVLAIGSAATELLGRGGKARAVRPVRDGNLLDYEVAGTMLQHIIGRIVGRQRIFRPDVMLSVPPMVTGIERRQVLEATMQAGAKTAYLIEKPLAAAIGARLPVATTDGVLVVNLGAGATEAAAIAQGEMLAMESIPTGGDNLDAALAAAIEERHGLRLAAGEGERLKVELGSAVPPAGARTAAAAGIDAAGHPRTVRVTDSEVHDSLTAGLQAIAAGIQRVLAQLPSERQSAIRRNGAVLTGGGALLHGISEYLSGASGIPVRVARDPQSCVAIGTGVALDNLQVVRRGQHYIG